METLVTPFAMLMAAFAVKHAIADGPLQTKYQYSNKGKYGHLGGIVHSSIHGLISLVFILFWAAYYNQVAFSVIALAIAIEVITHYHFDWLKINLDKKYGWSKMGVDEDGRYCMKIYHNHFYWAMVADQAAHFLIYVLMTYIILSV